MRVLFVSLFIVIVDQASKLFVKGFSIPFLNIKYEGMYHGQRIPILGDFFRLTFIENPGMAFGFDPGLDYKLWISVFSLIASVALISYLYFVRRHYLSMRIALAFILGGAVGNMIDRMFYGIFYGYAPLFYGKVVDFFDFDFFNVTIFGRNYDRWPVFNVADAAVTIGVLIMIIFYRKHQSDKTEEIETEPALENIYPAVINPDAEEEIKGTGNGEPDKGKEIPL